MSASEIISSHVSASHAEGPARWSCTFALRRFFEAGRRALEPGRAWTANVLRGAFGSVLKRLDADAYTQFFTPSAQSFPRVALPGKSPNGWPSSLPSGLNDLPRPFVFRLRAAEIGINLFLTSRWI